IDAPSGATYCPNAAPAPDFTERAEKSRSVERTVAIASLASRDEYSGGPGCAHAAGALAGASGPPAETIHASSFQPVVSRCQKERYWMGATDVSVSVSATRR